MDEHLIDLIKINKTFNGDAILHDVDLYIRKNEFLTILGPSGCGKTTTLRIIGGFEQATSGDLLFKNKSILNLPPHKRPLNTVFQKYALFPNMNVFENVAFGLKIKKMDKKIIETKVKKMLDLVNLPDFENRDVSSLSGGQQQRIAIARALVNEPEVLLLDEPLGALDLKLRKEMQTELKNMQKNLGITFIYVTHDQEEALAMSDTITIMNKGEIQQIGTPEAIYNEPKNAFVGNFIGASNIVDGFMEKDFEVKIYNRLIPCVDKLIDSENNVDVIIRPEDILIVAENEGQLTGIVKEVTFFGIYYEMIIESSGHSWKVHSTSMTPKGSSIGLKIPPDATHIMKKVAK